MAQRNGNPSETFGGEREWHASDATGFPDSGDEDPAQDKEEVIEIDEDLAEPTA